MNPGRDEEVLVSCRWCSNQDVVAVTNFHPRAVSIKTTLLALKVDLTGTNGWQETLVLRKGALLNGVSRGLQLVLLYQCLLHAHRRRKCGSNCFVYLPLTERVPTKLGLMTGLMTVQLTNCQLQGGALDRVKL